jgi:molybdopterin converting factor small subunit
MKVRVLFFGATADAAGRRDDEVQVEAGSSLGSVTDVLLQNYPSLNTHKLLFALNEEYAPPDRQLADGDELAVFTPVSGG